MKPNDDMDSDRPIQELLFPFLPDPAQGQHADPCGGPPDNNTTSAQPVPCFDRVVLGEMHDGLGIFYDPQTCSLTNSSALSSNEASPWPPPTNETAPAEDTPPGCLAPERGLGCRLCRLGRDSSPSMALGASGDPLTDCPDCVMSKYWDLPAVYSLMMSKAGGPPEEPVVLRTNSTALVVGITAGVFTLSALSLTAVVIFVRRLRFKRRQQGPGPDLLVADSAEGSKNASRDVSPPKSTLSAALSHVVPCDSDEEMAEILQF